MNEPDYGTCACGRLVDIPNALGLCHRCVVIERVRMCKAAGALCHDDWKWYMQQRRTLRQHFHVDPDGPDCEP